MNLSVSKHLQTLILVIATIVFIASAKYLINPQIDTKIPTYVPVNSPGSIVLSQSVQALKTAAYGDKNITILNFDLTADNSEDIVLNEINFAVYPAYFYEKLDESSIYNIRLTDKDGKVYASAKNISFTLNQYQQQKAFIYLKGKVTIPKGATKNLSLIADVMPNPSISGIKVTIPDYGKSISEHVSVYGVSSFAHIKIEGEARLESYIKPNDNIGSLTIYGSKGQISPKSKGTGIQIGNIHLSATDEEDITITKIALRLTNFIPGQFKNLKLVNIENGLTFGNVLINPSVTDTSNPNLIFKGNLTLKKGASTTYALISDVNIPTHGEYGIQLQRELETVTPSKSDYPKWITAHGVSTKLPVYLFGDVLIWLTFEE